MADVRDLAGKLVNRRLETLRQLGRETVGARKKEEPPAPPAEPQVPIFNIQVVVPPEAFKIVVQQEPAQVTVNVPELKQPTINVTPKITVEAPTVKLEPKIEVQCQHAAESTPRPKKATITHADGTESTVELK